jgi:serine-type D-Ala-D-Ala carboxypeptidase/endopeptidase (penicillin-binding protein 4)
MFKTFVVILQLCIPLISFSQERSVAALLADSSMLHGSISVCITDDKSGNTVFELNSGKSLIPASVMKLITSAAAIELLGPGYTFKTVIGYTGSLNKRSGRLKGNIVIIGGGDPALGSKYFTDHYQDFLKNWVTKIKSLGITKIDGSVITDDSRYDFQPVPSKWLWEDIGNYYGAGVYGLSVFDNTYEIHLKSSGENSTPVITGIIPSGSGQIGRAHV